MKIVTRKTRRVKGISQIPYFSNPRGFLREIVKSEIYDFD